MPAYVPTVDSNQIKNVLCDLFDNFAWANGIFSKVDVYALKIVLMLLVKNTFHILKCLTNYPAELSMK